MAPRHRVVNSLLWEERESNGRYLKYSVNPFQQPSISNTQKVYFTTFCLGKITKITPFAL